MLWPRACRRWPVLSVPQRERAVEILRAIQSACGTNRNGQSVCSCWPHFPVHRCIAEGGGRVGLADPGTDYMPRAVCVLFHVSRLLSNAGSYGIKARHSRARPRACSITSEARASSLPETNLGKPHCQITKENGSLELISGNFRSFPSACTSGFMARFVAYSMHRFAVDFYLARIA